MAVSFLFDLTSEAKRDEMKNFKKCKRNPLDYWKVKKNIKTIRTQ
jgi:hypothetical protein